MFFVIQMEVENRVENVSKMWWTKLDDDLIFWSYGLTVSGVSNLLI